MMKTDLIDPTTKVDYWDPGTPILKVGDSIDFGYSKSFKWRGTGIITNIVGNYIYICKTHAIASLRRTRKNVIKKLNTREWKKTNSNLEIK